MAKRDSFPGTSGRLKELRHQLGYSRPEMAARLGVSVAAYYKNENNTTIPSVQSLLVMIKEYDIAMDWFLLGRGPMFFHEERDRVKGLEQSFEGLKNELEKEREKRLELEQRNKECEEELQKERARVLEMEKERERLLEMGERLKELEKVREKEVDRGSGRMQARPEVQELLSYMERVPLLYHELLVYFHRFVKENREFIDGFMPDPHPGV